MRNFGTVAETNTSLKIEAKLIGLEREAAKTNNMRVRSFKDDYLRLQPSIKVSVGELKVVNLRLLMTTDNDTSKRIRSSIVAESTGFIDPCRILRSNRTELTLYKTLMRPVVFYEHET